MTYRENAPRNWQKWFFQKKIFFPGDPDHVAAAPKEVAFLWRVLKLKKGKYCLDLGCGTGRHSILLAKRGINVVGLDSTLAYIRNAQKKGRGIQNLRFIHGDMRRIPFSETFDAIINLWTSFGYFAKLQTDFKVLQGVFHALKPGGFFLMDVSNGDFVRKQGSGRIWHRGADGSYRLEDFRMHEGNDPRHVNTWTIIRYGQRPLTATFVVRCYNHVQLFKLLRRAGFRPLRLWGDTGGGRFRRGKSKRLVILAGKPASLRQDS